MSSKFFLAPSILAADFANMEREILKIEAEKAHIVHLDVMDGNFVAPISFGAQMVKSIRPYTKLPFDVHLMVAEPERHIDSFIAAGADWLTFHLEAAIHAHALASRIKRLGKSVGVSIVPSTPVSQVVELLDLVDLVLIMSVNPGYGGQQLIASSLDKIQQLGKLRARGKHKFKISIDGGINKSNIVQVKKLGADIAVVGSAFFSTEQPEHLVKLIS